MFLDSDTSMLQAVEGWKMSATYSSFQDQLKMEFVPFFMTNCPILLTLIFVFFVFFPILMFLFFWSLLCWQVEVKPYVLDDQLCDECQGARCSGKFAPFFCANVTCLQYYCEYCWAAIHSRAGREFHKPLVKEGGDRPRHISFRWNWVTHILNFLPKDPNKCTLLFS